MVGCPQERAPPGTWHLAQVPDPVGLAPLLGGSDATALLL